MAGPALAWQTLKGMKMTQFDTNVCNLPAEINGLNTVTSLTDNSHPLTVITINKQF